MKLAVTLVVGMLMFGATILSASAQTPAHSVAHIRNAMFEIAPVQLALVCPKGTHKSCGRYRGCKCTKNFR